MASPLQPLRASPRSPCTRAAPTCFSRRRASARATAAQARLLEGVLLDALADIGQTFGTPFITLHGNIPRQLAVSAEDIPRGWNLARQRYLRRCVALFGESLATAGIHTNHSFPEALLSWDFFHLPLSERQGRTLVDYRNQAVIRATRLLRPVCPVFIAVSAASPFAWEEVDGRHEVVLTDNDACRLLAFPNPEALDVPGLYASHDDYIRISYGLVRSGARFGANNWTPVRARSDVDPVRRNIMATSEQLRELYRRGIYPTGEHGSLEEAEQALVVENLCARVDLPMERVEVRTDEGGDDLALSTAKILFKELLMLRFYADPEYGAAYSYDAQDIVCARCNEEEAARRGLAAQLRHPMGGGTITARDYLAELLGEIEELAEGLGVSEELEPLRAMAGGDPNPAETIRAWMVDRLGGDERSTPKGSLILPPSLLREWFEERRDLIADEVESTNDALLGADDLPAGRFDACLAEFQSRGRGRRGRSWLAPFGSGLCLSVNWRFEESPAQLSALPLAIGVAIRRALRDCGVAGTALKWPNDLLFRDRKLGGVLVEMLVESAGPAYAVVGVGLNFSLPDTVRRAIRETGIDVASLDEAGTGAEALQRSKVAAALLGRLCESLEEFDQRGFGPFQEEWSEADALRGRPVRVHQGEEAREGVACGIDLDGALLVEIDGRVARFVAGDVSLRPAA